MITPQTKEDKLARELGLKYSLYLKREDLHPHQSHKGRSIPIMIEKMMADGVKSFGISSSGNAALSAIKTINRETGISLKIFVGQNIDDFKYSLLKREIVNNAISIEKTERPKQKIFQLEKEGRLKSLRQSTNDTALIGYHNLADELLMIEDLSAVFIPTSSGTTAQALGERFRDLGKQIQIHIVQTTACHPIVDGYDKDFTDGASTANAIVDQIALRTHQVKNEINLSHGYAWVVDDRQIKEAIQVAHEICQIEISVNSALSIAGLKKALDNDIQFVGSVVCLITGR